MELLDTIYFVFVSMSTIGFWDIVPAHDDFILVSSLYLILGLVVVAIVLNSTMTSFSTKIATVQKYYTYLHSI